MITDQLDKCPFCHANMKLYTGEDEYYLACPFEENHTPNIMFVWYVTDCRDTQISAVNVRVGDYQLMWDIRKDKTTCFNHTMNRAWSSRTIVELPGLLDISLDEQTIRNKIKTLLTFS